MTDTSFAGATVAPAAGTVPFPAVVVADTREQLPYTFENIPSDSRHGRRPYEVRVERRKLDAADYSLAGHEGRIGIERKEAADFLRCVAQDRRRFEAELLRLQVYDFAMVLVEAELRDLLYAPPSGVSPASMLASVVAWQQRFGVHFCFGGDRRTSEVIALRTLARWHEDNVALAAEDAGKPEPFRFAMELRDMGDEASRPRRLRHALQRVLRDLGLKCERLGPLDAETADVGP